MSLQIEPFTPGVYESRGSIVIGGQEIPYRTVCRDNLLYDETGVPIGSMFTYSYFRSDVTDVDSRPVMFFFNGGPGSGSVWLHMGLFAPLRVRFDNPEAVNTPSVPPYRAEPNDLCMLDLCDLVFIDPVGTGYGRLLVPEAADRFYGLDADAESFKHLIHSWLNIHRRFLSPKYLFGESYGTVRAALLSDKLSSRSQDLSIIGLNGIVLLGNAIGNLDVATEKRLYDAEPALLALPTIAAVNWYHNRMPGTLKEFVDACYAFCDHDYLLALFAGSDLAESERERIAERVAYFSGLKKAEVLRQNLRPDMMLSWRQILEDRGLEVGRLDGRFTLPFGTRTGNKQDSVAVNQYGAAFMAAMCGPAKTALNITHNREYYAISTRDGLPWKRTYHYPPHECLSAAMRRNPDLRVMFATGYYDMVCQIGQARYLATHGGYPRERVDIREYPSGHMVYLGEESAALFARDVRRFICSGK